MKGFRFWLGLILLLIVLTIALVGGRGKIALVVDLKDVSFEPGFSGLWKEKIDPWELRECLRKAQDDKRVVALVVKSGEEGAGIGWEIKGCIDEWKQSGKPVYGYLKTPTQHAYWRICGADRVFVSTSKVHYLLFPGLRIVNLYIGELLKSIGIKFWVLHQGRYKGVGDHLVEGHMSSDLKEELMRFLKRYADVWVSTLAHDRGLSKGEFYDMWVKGEFALLPSYKAVSLGLVDSIPAGYSLEEWIKDNEGVDAKFVSVLNYGGEKWSKFLPSPKIVILPVVGEMSLRQEVRRAHTGASTFVKQIEEILRDDDVRGVVVWVNSPGGLVSAAEEMWRALRRLKGKKPIVICMGGIAASGGYYISTIADKIVACPLTITGSIGVVSIVPDLGSLMERFDVQEDGVAVGEMAGFLSPFHHKTHKELSLFEDQMDSVYEVFLTKVRKGRGMKDLSALAEGRLWTGVEAVSLGLVDTLGDLADAVELVADMCSLSVYRVEWRGTSFGLMDYIEEFMSVLSQGGSVLWDDYRAGGMYYLCPWCVTE